MVEDRLAAAETLREKVAFIVSAPETDLPSNEGILPSLVEPPFREKNEARVLEKGRAERAYGFRNYLEIEARNHSLGLAGETMVLNFEYERLWKAGKRKLAERLEHVSKTKGDYLGYCLLYTSRCV